MKLPSKIVKHVSPRRGGRPSRQQAEQIEGQILDIARDLFFTHGYGATSIEMIAKKAGISKRTFYHRFPDKAALFRAVVKRLIEGLRPADAGSLFVGQTIEKILVQIADIILQASLSPHALALHRIILAEVTRFPELAQAVNQQGTRKEAITRISALLAHETNAKRLAVSNPSFAAEQFLQMVVSAPQRHALGLGDPMSSADIKTWARDTVDLFLNGCRRPFETP